MTTLVPGANGPLTSTRFALTVQHGGLAGADIDVSAFLVAPTGKVRSDEDMCFYGQPSVGNGCLSLAEGTATGARFDIVLDNVPAGVEKIVVAATIHENKATFGKLKSVDLAGGGLMATIPCDGKTESALLLAEIYQRNGAWKLRVLGQGFNGGLAALAKHLGVDIAAPEPTPSPAPAPRAPAPVPTPAPTPAPPRVDTTRPAVPPRIDTTRPAPAAAPAAQAAPRVDTNRPAAPVNLNKVKLTKESRTVSLRKGDGRFGQMRVNLNWTQGASKGLSSMFAPKPVDLDLGCFVEDRYGNKTCIQALGNTFGDYDYFPYAKLRGDDRTGAVRDGEWLDINGDMWSEFNRILIFAFIYDGAPNWSATDGTIRIMMPDQPEVEIKMNEANTQDGMCAIALLENDGGRIALRREMQFFKGHRFLDEHYGWGMRWAAGRK